MKLGENLTPGHDVLLLLTSGTGSFSCPYIAYSFIITRLLLCVGLGEAIYLAPPEVGVAIAPLSMEPGAMFAITFEKQYV